MYQQEPKHLPTAEHQEAPCTVESRSSLPDGLIYSISYAIRSSSVFLVDCQKRKKQSGFPSTGELKGPVLLPGEINITSVSCRVYRRALHERHKDAGARARDTQGQGGPQRETRRWGSQDAPRHEHGQSLPSRTRGMPVPRIAPSGPGSSPGQAPTAKAGVTTNLPRLDPP